MSADAVAALPGKPAPRIEKRAADARVFTIDCTPLLRKFELLAQVLDVQAHGLDVSGARTRRGLAIEVHVAGGDVPAGQPYKDFSLSASVRTSQGTIGVAVDFRVHR